jgi:hypothetical protein
MGPRDAKLDLFAGEQDPNKALFRLLAVPKLRTRYIELCREIATVTEGCRTAGIGCLDCKRIMIKHVLAEIAPIAARRAELDQSPDLVGDVLATGNAAAQRAAAETMGAVREAMKI